jgi:hypothetical protein
MVTITLGYEATVKELDDNLLGMGAVKMLMPSELNKEIRFKALNYLMFLKSKRCGKIKQEGVLMADHRENTYRRMNLVLLRYLYTL